MPFNDLVGRAWVCGRSLAKIAGSNPAWGMAVCLVSVVWCQVGASAMRQFVVQGSSTESVCVFFCMPMSVVRGYSNPLRLQ
jgi:hypothetical protein